ncbi:MAG: hypothetical protein DME86_03655 [Verrucomicrobia bacterium]|nr:MAG: hypothetical protein DME86_03655 [Verrucomicrobiota bacterium]
MRVSDYDEHEALLNATGQRNWLFFGLVISLILHLILCAYFYGVRFTPAEVAVASSSQPPTFKVKSVEPQAALDKASVDQLNPAAKPEPDKTDVQLPDEKKSFDQLLQDVQATTAVPDDTQNVLPDKPRVDPTDATSMLTEIERSTAQTLSKSPNGTREQTMANDVERFRRLRSAATGVERH